MQEGRVVTWDDKRLVMIFSIFSPFRLFMGVSLSCLAMILARVSMMRNGSSGAPAPETGDVFLHQFP